MRQNSRSGDLELGTMGYHTDLDRNTHPNTHNVANSLPFAQIQGFFSVDLRIDSRYLRFMDPRLQKAFEMAAQYGQGPIHWLCSFLGTLYIAFYILPTPRFELTLSSPCNFLQNLSFTLFICLVLTLHVPMVIYKWATNEFEAKARELVHVLTAKLLKSVGAMASNSNSSSPSTAKGQQQPEQKRKRKSASKDMRFPSQSGVEGDDAKVSNDNVFHFKEIRNELNRRSSGDVMTYNTARSKEKTKHLSMTDGLMNLISGPKTYEYANKISHYTQIFIIAMGQICIVMSFVAFSLQTQECPPEDVEFVAMNYDKFIGCYPLNSHGNQETIVYLLHLFYPMLSFMIMDIYPRMANLLLISCFSISLIINIVKAHQDHDHTFTHVIRMVSSPLFATLLICYVMHQHIHRKLETFVGNLHKSAYLQLASATVYDSKNNDIVQQDSTEDLDHRGGHLQDMIGYGNFNQSQPLQYGGNYQSPYEQNQGMIRNVHSNAGYNAYIPFQQTWVIPQCMNVEGAPRINDTYRSVLQNGLHDMYIHKAGRSESDDIDFEHTHAGDRSDTGVKLEIDNQPALQIQPLSENALQYHTNYLAGQYGGLTKPLHRFIYDSPETTANGTQAIEKRALVEQSQANEKHAHGISPGGPLGGGRGDKLSQKESQQNPKSPMVDQSESRESVALPGIEQQQTMLSVLPSAMPLQSSKTNYEDERRPVLRKGVGNDTHDTIISDLTAPVHGPCPPNHTNSRSRLSSESISDSRMHDADTADDSFAYTYNYEYGHGQDAEKISDEGSRFHGKEGSRTSSR